MKKFCSECGHPLEISKKFCSDCGTQNPYFSIGHEAPSGRSSAIDELRARKESIERELEEIEREQTEVQHKAKLQREMEELERQRQARLEKEKQIKERFEREEIEASFKKEILQVKEENEQYKQQTHKLLVELRDVIAQIEEENKRLKEEVELIAKAKVAEPEMVEAVEPEPPITAVAEPMPVASTEEATTGSSGKVIGVAVSAIAVVSIALGVFLFNKNDKAEPVKATNETSVTEAPATEPVIVEEEKSATETTPKAKANTVIVSTPAKTDVKPKAAFSLTLTQAKDDLIGRKLSGCGITLIGAANIDRIAEPVMVESLPEEGYVKYKLDMHIVQDGETYHVTPYMYYTPKGKFMRVDASNCE